MRGKFSLWQRSILVLSSWALSAAMAGLGTALVPVHSVGAADVKLGTPRANDRQIARMVTSLIKREHLSKHPLDDEISQRGLHLFIKALDNRKLYFTQADIAEFEKSKNDLDDQVNGGDVSFAYTVFNRFQQ